MGLRGPALVVGAVLTALVCILLYCSQWSGLQLYGASSWQPMDDAGPDCTACDPESDRRSWTKEKMMTVMTTGEDRSGVQGGSLNHSVGGNQQNVSSAVRPLPYMPPSAPCGQPSSMATSKPQADTFSHGPFIAESKNPCWWNKGANPNATRQLRCLPYFFLAGVSKCGSTDIFSRLSGHPNIVPPSVKEPRWFDWKRYAPEGSNFTQYVSNFMQAAWQISRDIDASGSSEKVVGDGSPTYFWRNFHWGEYRGNEGCKEPRLVIAHTIRRLLPQARIIISFRNPVSAIYSKYLSGADKGAVCSPEHFHSLVVEEVRRYRLCFARSSVRSCAYNATLSMQAKVRLEKGLYAVFLSDWLRVFPRRQLHILRFEDYIQDIAGHLQAMFLFLGLKPMPDKDLQQLASLPAFNQGHHYSVGHMLPATQRLLQQFYASFNAHLSQLLGEKRYLWVTPQ